MFELLLQNWWMYLVVAVGSYLFGAINFSIIFSHLFKGQDIRHYGSKNAGTTNMFRVYGFSLGMLTFVCDALKGAFACLLTKWIFSFCDAPLVTQLCYFAGLFCVLGHIFPVYYGWNGGKGVASSIGVAFALQPLVTLCLLLPMLVILLLTDRMSVMSLFFSVFCIVWAWVVMLPDYGALCCIAYTVHFALVLFAHRQNIVRIFSGKELPTGIRRIFGKKSKDD